jgi:hypothetical protein
MTTLGAIRWDGFYSNEPGFAGSYTAASLSPIEYQSRAPLHASVFHDRISYAFSQETMDAEITAAATCLDYWAFLKYPPGSVGLENGWDLYQSSSIKTDIDWCWIVDNARFGSTGNYSAIVAELTAHMQQSNYMKVLTNRPLMYILWYDQYLDSLWGGNPLNFKACLDAIRASVQGAGLGNPYIVLQRYIAASTATLSTTLGTDAISSYVSPIDGTFDQSYATFDTKTRANWATYAATGAKIVPIAMIGWNQAPRIKIVNPYVSSYNKPYFALRTDVEVPTLAEITTHIDAAFDYVAAHPTPCQAGTILAYAWNEHDEGGWIAPTIGDPTGLRCAAVAAGRS